MEDCSPGRLPALTLRAVAAEVGMQSPSLYNHFGSKNAIYDAMFGQSWSEFLAVMNETELTLPRAPRAALKAMASTFFEFAVADLVRFQLMNQRTVPGFVPSPQAYAPAVEVLTGFQAALIRIGMTDPAGLDLCTALLGGLVDAQLANDPGGHRWQRLLPRAMDMLADEMRLPRSRQRRTTS